MPLSVLSTLIGIGLLSSCCVGLRHNLAGNPTNIDYAGKALDVTLKNDGFGRLTNVVDATGATRCGYTPGGLPARDRCLPA